MTIVTVTAFMIMDHGAVTVGESIFIVNALILSAQHQFAESIEGNGIRSINGNEIVSIKYEHCSLYITAMTYAEELRTQRKSSLIVVCTLGLASLFMKSVRPIWMNNLFEGTSFMQNEGLAFVLKAMSFFFLGLLTAGIMFIIHLIKVIYYSIEISRHP